MGISEKNVRDILGSVSSLRKYGKQTGRLKKAQKPQEKFLCGGRRSNRLHWNTQCSICFCEIRIF